MPGPSETLPALEQRLAERVLAGARVVVAKVACWTELMCAGLLASGLAVVERGAQSTQVSTVT